MGDGKIYEEHPVPGGGSTVTAVWFAVVLAALLAFVVDNGTVLTVLLLVVLVGFIVAVMISSTGRYFKISLDNNRLNIGRDSVELSDLDPAFGVRPAEDVLDDSMLASLEVGVSSKRGDLRIMGGGWGRPGNGSKFVVVRDRQDGLHVIATRNRGRFSQTLAGALGVIGRP